MEIRCVCVCGGGAGRGCLDVKSHVCNCAKANTFVPNVPDIDPVKTSECRSDLHHKDNIFPHLSALLLRGELPQSRTNYIFNKDWTQHKAAVCEVDTIEVRAEECVWAKVAKVEKLWRNMSGKSLPCSLVCFGGSCLRRLAQVKVKEIQLVNLKCSPRSCKAMAKEQ